MENCINFLLNQKIGQDWLLNFSANMIQSRKYFLIEKLIGNYFYQEWLTILKKPVKMSLKNPKLHRKNMKAVIIWNDSWVHAYGHGLYLQESFWVNQICTTQFSIHTRIKFAGILHGDHWYIPEITSKIRLLQGISRW